MDINETAWRALSGFVWLRIETGGGFLWIVHQINIRISWKADNFLTSRAIISYKDGVGANHVIEMAMLHEMFCMSFHVPNERIW
jgi:hypothetical protein